MINDFQKNVISIVRGAMTNKAPELTEDVNMEKVYEYAQGAQIVPLLYYGLQDIPGFFDNIIGKKFFMSTMNYMSMSQEQMSELDRVCNALDKAGVSYMKLKGSLIKNYYEYPEMRTMSDADILIKIDEYDKLKAACEEIGYYQTDESDHEYIWESDEKKLTIEFHKWLIPSYNKDYFEYFGVGWDFAKKVDGKNSEYQMSDEDFFVYIFAHFAKHYRDSGVGIKYLTDFYLFLKKKPNLDMEYIKKAFKKLQMDKFWDNVDKLLRVWFDCEESNDVIDHMTNKMFGSYTYGLTAHNFKSDVLKRSNAGESNKKITRKKFLQLVFLPYKNMKMLYPVLEKAPILLPFVTVHRWLCALFFKKSRVKWNMENIKSINDDDIEAHHNELTYVGLDYNF